MWKRNLLLLISAALGISILAFYWSVVDVEAPVAAEVETPAPPTMLAPFVTLIDPSKGPQDAALTIVEFGDYACPYCRTSQKAIDRLLSEHPTEVRFVWKSAPSPLHPDADTASEAALCAARQGKFWEFHERLFENAGLFDQSSMVILAGEMRLDTEAFGECLSTRATRPLVDRTVTEAKALGLTGIPTIFVGGTRFDGALSYEQLLDATGL